MKIILKAFNDMYSKPMDIPENSTNEWDMALTQPLQVITGFIGQEIGNIPPLMTLCKFKWTGKSIHLKDLGYNSEEFARVYVLSDIIKR